jgi:hypothetical protein
MIRRSSLLVFAFLAVATVVAACSGSVADDRVMCAGVACGPEEWCQESYNNCTEAPPMMFACGGCLGVGPICGDDGQVYATDCALHAAGHAPGSSCAAPAGLDLCGSLFCDVSVEYCYSMPDHCFSPSGYTPTCAPLPDGGLLHVDAGPIGDEGGMDGGSG